MQIVKKAKLSSDFIFTKLACLFGVGLTFQMIVSQNVSDPNFDLKTNLEYKLYFVVLSVLTIYFFTRPKIRFDEINLYIKKFTKEEMAIPLKNVKTIFYNPLGFRRGGYTYSIEYKFNSNEDTKIKFYLQYNFLDKLKEFIRLVKIHNPNVEVI